MLVVLKIPVVYLGCVVWWAIRAEPLPEGGPDEALRSFRCTPCGWDDWRGGAPRGAAAAAYRPYADRRCGPRSERSRERDPAAARGRTRSPGSCARSRSRSPASRSCAARGSSLRRRSSSRSSPADDRVAPHARGDLRRRRRALVLPRDARRDLDGQPHLLSGLGCYNRSDGALRAALRPERRATSARSSSSTSRTPRRSIPRGARSSRALTTSSSRAARPRRGSWRRARDGGNGAAAAVARAAALRASRPPVARRSRPPAAPPIDELLRAVASRWRSSTRSARTGTSPPASTRSARSRSATRRSTRPSSTCR